jgi:hypothetical protein
MFELALRRNQTQFVKLFFDHDFSLIKAFENKKILPSLYINTINEVSIYLFNNSYFICLFSVMIRN